MFTDHTGRKTLHNYHYNKHFKLLRLIEHKDVEETDNMQCLHKWEAHTYIHIHRSHETYLHAIWLF